MSLYPLTSLIRVVRQRIVDLCLSTAPEKFKVLVVDEHTSKILNAAMKLSELVDLYIATVDSIGVERQPFPDMDAIYFISPTSESVTRLISDFEGTFAPRYHTAHLLFCSHVGDAIVSRLKSSAATIRRVKTFKEINIDFLALESQVFSLNRPNGLYNLFSPNSTSKAAEVSRCSEQLLTLLRSLDETLFPPIIRHQNSELSRSIALTLQEQLRTAIGKPNSASKPQRDPAVVLILDRSFDPLSPLLHEFTYQAMIHDLLNIEKDIYQFESKSTADAVLKKEFILNEKFGSLWANLRSMHIMDVISKIKEDYESFKVDVEGPSHEQGGYQADAQKGRTRVELERAIHSMPMRREQALEFAAHISLTDECMTAFKRSNVADLAAVEQDIATGEDSLGNPIRNLVSSVMSVSEKASSSANSSRDIIRVLMMYVISQGIKSSDKELIFQTFKLKPEAQAAICNLEHLNVVVTRKTNEKRADRMANQGRKKRGDDVPYELSRYVPRIKDIMEDLSRDQLLEAEFPHTSSAKSPAPSFSTQTKAKLKNWAAGSSEKDDSNVKGCRFIVFIAGGMTYSEIRSAYETTKSSKREFIIGSTHILTPSSWVESVGKLDPTNIHKK